MQQGAVMTDAVAPGVREVPFATRLAAALLAGGLGAVMLFGVGFAQIDAVHNAAHDTRHAVSFPCH